MTGLIEQLKVVLPDANEVQLQMTVMLVREALREELKQERKRDLARTRKRHQRDRERDIGVTKTGQVTAVSPLDPPSEEISLSDPEIRILSKPDQRDPHSDEPALLAFPTVGNPRQFSVKEHLRRRHAEAFPALDVLLEYRRALAWVNASPSNRKTARGMEKFLFGWLSRAQNSGRQRDIGVTANGHAKPSPPMYDPEAEDPR